MKRFIFGIISFVFLFNFIHVSAGERFRGSGFIRNFSASDYLGHPQNWKVIQDASGLVFVANNFGVMEFDGSNWRIYPLPGNVAARSMALTADGLLYVAAKNEFGFIGLDSLGQRAYFSMKSMLPDSLSIYLDLRQVHVIGEDVFFRSNELLLRIRGNELKYWKPSESFHRSYALNGDYYIMSPGKGLNKLIDDELILTKGGALLKDYMVYALLPYDDKNYLIATRENGIFFIEKKTLGEKYEGNASLKPFKTSDDAWFKKNHVYYGRILQDGAYAFSTFYGGFVVVSPDGEILERYNSDTGLLSDAVWAIGEDRLGNFWVCMNNGVAYLERNPSVVSWGEAQGLKGIVQAAVIHKGSLYAISNFGVSVYQNGLFSKIGDFDSFSWDLIEVIEDNDKILLLASSNGIFRISNNRFSTIVKDVQALKFVAHPQKPDLIYCGLIDGVKVLQLENGRWVSKGRIPGVKGEVRSLVFDQHDNLWVTVFLEGILRMEFSESNGVVPQKVIRYTEADGLPDHTGLTVYRASNKVIVSLEKGIYVFNEESLRFDPWDVFEGGNIQGYSVAPFFEDKNGDIYLYARKAGDYSRKLRRYKKFNGAQYKQQAVYARFPDMAVYVLSDAGNGWLWVGGSDGLFKVNATHQPLIARPLPAILSRVVVGADSVVHHGFFKNHKISLEGFSAFGWTLQQPANYIQRFDYKQNSISFHFSSTSIIDQKKQKFSFRLDGFEDQWSPWVSENKKEYTNLPSGSYVFRLKTMDALGYESEEVIYAFVIETPWFFKPWAWIVYFISFLSLVWLIIYITGRRLKYKNLVLQRLITERTREIMRQTEEIQEKNEELMQQREEILAQSAELEKINRTLENRIQEAINKSREKDMMLIQQSRLAAMGEMIGNIAHQWRQPLNAVGIIIQNINEAYRCNELTPEYMDAKVEKSMDIIQYMSQTIDDFRNFFKPEKKMHLFDVKATVQRAVSFIEPTLLNNQIELECFCDNQIQVMGYSNEYAQVVLNLLNNAKDAVMENNIPNPKITVSLKMHDGKSVLYIDDNGGGIAPEYIDKIFTPYFSTKNPSKGTGIGLYMSKTIVEKNMHGSLTFKNTEEGARFTIVV